VRLRRGEGLSHLPRWSAWWRCYGAFETPEETLLPSDIGVPVGPRGENELLATRRGEPAWYTLGPTDGRTPLQHYITHSATAEEASLRLAAHWTETDLTLHFHWPTPSAGFQAAPCEGAPCALRVAVKEAGPIGGRNSLLERLPPGSVLGECAEDGYSLQVRIPWAILPAALASEGAVTFVVAAGGYERLYRKEIEIHDLDLEPGVVFGVRVVHP